MKKAFPKEAVEGTIVDRFAAVVSRFLNRDAVRDGVRSLSYRELDDISSSVAQRLVADYGGLGLPIPILTGHGMEEIIAMLAVLKSGNAYIALDPNMPFQRLHTIADDVEAKVILANASNHELATRLGAQIIDLADLAGQPHQPMSGAENLRDIAAGIKPEDLSSLVYTSGSTGRPKGVMRSHRCSLHRCYLLVQALDVNCTDRIGHLFSCAFAAAEVDVYGALLNGATLCCYSSRDSGPGPLAKWLKNERVTILHPPQALFRKFLDYAAPNLLMPDLRVISLAGEALTRRELEDIRLKFPTCTLEHRFSTSETSVLAFLLIERGNAFVNDIIPVGFVPEGKQVLLLGDDGNEVSCGEVGEIAVQSRYLATGYWRQPALTGNKFSSSHLPFTFDPDAKVYRTGDLGRFNSEGMLEHLGRIDRQLKVNGYLVAPEEVELLLRGSIDIQAAAVFPGWDKDGHIRLFAAVVPVQKELWCEAGMRRFLAQKLPRYMIPTYFKVMDALPTTETGKTDISFLSAQSSVVERHDLSLEPDNLGSIGNRVRMLWEQVLELNESDYKADFFDVGGDSLKAFTLCAAIESHLGITLLPIVVYETRTLDALTRAVLSNPVRRDCQQLVALNRRGQGPKLFLMHCLGGDILYAHNLARFLGSGCQVYAMQPDTVFGKRTRHGSLEVLAADYLKKIRDVQRNGPYWIGGFSFGGIIAYEIARQLIELGESVAGLFLFDTWTPRPYRFPDPRPESRSETRRGPLRRWRRSFRKRGKKHLKKTFRRFCLDTFIALGFSLPLPQCIEYTKLVNYRLSSNYVARPILCKTYLFRSEDNLAFRSAGWERLCAVNLSVISIPGSHLNIFKLPTLPILAQTLDNILSGDDTCSTFDGAIGSESCFMKI